MTRCLDKSIPFGREDEIQSFFEDHGFVVVRDVFSEEELGRCLEELWSSERLFKRSEAIRRDEPRSWTQENGWPQQDGGKNFLESLDPFQDSSCWELAQNPRCAAVLKLLWAASSNVEEVFLGRTPRWGVMRPAAHAPEWRTLENWLHWDQNPWSQPGFGWIQAFACITDQTPSSGGLLCVPGFHKRWQCWGEDHPEGSVEVDGKLITRYFGAGNPFPVPWDDPVQQQTVRIMAPKGSLVLWDSRLPHQNFPNSSEDEWRIILYLNFWPFREETYKERQQVLQRRLGVLEALGLRGAWPSLLSAEGRRLTASPEAVALLSAEAQEAILLSHAAGEAELRGELQKSTALLRRAMKLWPEVEEWYEAIFV